jgi:hypothetical protein
MITMPKSIRIMQTIVAYNYYKIWQIDIKIAFQYIYKNITWRFSHLSLQGLCVHEEEIRQLWWTYRPNTTHKRIYKATWSL